LRIGSLWGRASGGGDVAARPDSSTADNWPTAPRPVGVEEASEWFLEGLHEAPRTRLLFLVGGPGAGKSHAASSIVGTLEPIGTRDDGLAHRAYPYKAGARIVTLVNDATIGTGPDNFAPLAHDIESAVNDSTHLIVCVNRGILVDELASLGRKNASVAPAGTQILNWLTRRPEAIGSDDVTTSVDKPYIVSSIFRGLSDIAIEAVAVYVDVCSLMEKRPAVDLVVDRADAYEICRFVDRPAMSTKSVPAGALLGIVIGELQAAVGGLGLGLIDPISANIRSLQTSAVQRALLSMLRCAEIVSGQKFTYREVWGAIVRCIVGELPEVALPSEIAAWIRDHQPSDDGTVVDSFGALMELADLRFSEALFLSKSDARGNPVTRLTQPIDPMRDAIPGNSVAEPQLGWFTPVANAFAGSATSGSPLKNLEDEVASDNPFWSAVNEFDRRLDEGFAAVMDAPLKDSDRAKFIHWYGAYVARLYAISNGIPAFRREISSWTDAWNFSPNVPDGLGLGLRTLLRPKRRPGDVESASLVPIFDSRTDPVVGVQLEPKIALMTGDVTLRTVTAAETILLVVEEKSVEVARILFDFPLVREAMACGSEHPGITELTGATSPRLERFRSMRLIPAKLHNADYRIVSGDADINLKVVERF
jgi:hypothetical protein